VTSPNGPGGESRRPLPAAVGLSDRERRAREAEQARADKAMQAGWVIRFDPDRLEYRASRELLTARSLGALLDEIDAHR
jgi:hypothetical protein